MAVVVRCTGCRGAAQVGSEAIGLLVVCPRCGEPFLAVEEAAVAKPRRARAEPIAPPKPARPSRRRRPEPPEPVPAVHDPHDPHDIPTPHAAGLPASVLIGLALLPFAIPLLWMIAPTVLGQQPALTLAAPSSLALSASVLCLAVVYTVDWTPATRIKGVLMLVGLSYFAGLSLFYLKKDLVDRAKEFFGGKAEGYVFRPPADATYEVKFPSKPQQWNEQPLPGCKLTCYRASEKEMAESAITYIVGSGTDPKPDVRGDDRWFDEVGRAVLEKAGVDAENFQGMIRVDIPPGRLWPIRTDDTMRFVRVYRVNGRIYYLSVEGKRLEADSPAVERFFRSFVVLQQPGK